MIRRTVPNPPVVENDNGEPVDLLPGEVLPRVEVYGQHEISELTGSPEKLTRLLDRFIEGRGEPAVSTRRMQDVLRGLRVNRHAIVDTSNELDALRQRLEALPGLEETLKRYQAAGLEAQLGEKSVLIREERIVDMMPQRLEAVEEAARTLRQELPLDLAFMSPGVLSELPDEAILAEGNEILGKLNTDLEQATGKIEAALARAHENLNGLKSRWCERKRDVDDAYERTLRKLQKSTGDAEEFVRIRQRVENLQPLRDDEAKLGRLLDEHKARRRNLLEEWEYLKAEELDCLKGAARRASNQLCNSVRVRISGSGDRSPLADLLRDELGGRLSEAISKLEEAPDLSLSEFIDRCRRGADALCGGYDIPPNQAKRLADAREETLMRIEELHFAPHTEVSLNVTTTGEHPSWRSLGELSKGQKATAVLLLLLLESEAPLIIDQPEDDLDNRFITDGVVPRMRQEKRRRQFVFSTHNANIPVLGDAELIAGLDARGDAVNDTGTDTPQGQAFITPERVGSIDKDSVRDLVEETLEGGRKAFETRRLKYGF